MFIVLEGIDGSGKSTQIPNIVHWLKTHGVAMDDICITREHTYDGEYGKRIQRILLGEEPHCATPRDFQELYVRDRKDHLERVILPHLAKGGVVVCDRYFLSTVAYGGAGGVAYEDIMAMHKTIIGDSFIMPDLTFLIDVSAETSAARLAERKKDRKPEYFDKKKMFLAKAAEIYKERVQLFENTFIINGEGTPEEVFSRIESILSSYFSNVRSGHRA